MLITRAHAMQRMSKTNNVNANTVVTSLALFVQRAGPKPPTPGA